jgi:hypothetical protein
MREVFAKNSDGAKQCPNARSQKNNVKVLLQNFGWRASLFDFKYFFLTILHSDCPLLVKEDNTQPTHYT